MGITISNSQGLWLGFSLRSTPQHLWVMEVYIAWVKKVCIRYDSSIKQNVSQVSRRKALPAKTNCPHPVLTLLILIICRIHASLCEMLTRELPAKTLQSSICLESSHTLSLSHTHTTLTNKSHNKYRVLKIK